MRTTAAHALRAGSAAASSNVWHRATAASLLTGVSSNIHPHPILQFAEKMIPPLSRAVLAAAITTTSVTALNNGLALTPPMGFSSWNVRPTLSSLLYSRAGLPLIIPIIPFPPSQAFSSNVTSAKMRNITRILIETGLAAKGYTSLHVDEGW
jgi:hypothetical protein